jgi:hypothetical protein
MPHRVPRYFTSSSESEDSAVDPFAEQQKKDLVIPSSDQEEELSPSQYQVEKEREDAADPLEAEEEVPEDVINSDEDGIDHSDPPSAQTGSPKGPSADAVYTKFINMGRQFVADLEDQRKQGLMARKAARKSLDFDDMCSPSGKQLQFTPLPASRSHYLFRQGVFFAVRIVANCSHPFAGNI